MYLNTLSNYYKEGTLLSHVGSGIVPINGVGQISYGHCLYHASPFCLITCIPFHQSIFLHLILHLLVPRLFPSSSTTTHFKFQSLHYHIFIFSQNMTIPQYTACFSHPIKTSLCPTCPSTPRCFFDCDCTYDCV